MNETLVKLDENMSGTHCQFLNECGYSADRVTDEGLSGAADSVVWQRVTNEGRFFITLDLDFSDVRKFSPGSHPGLLLIRAKTRGRSAVLDILKRVVQEHPLWSLRGCLIVADDLNTRIRRPHSGGTSE